jgi:hypothetical protein
MKGPNAKKKKVKNKPPTSAEIAHKKFLEKMGVTQKQLKEKNERLSELLSDDADRKFRPDSLQSVRRAYNEE